MMTRRYEDWKEKGKGTGGGGREGYILGRRCRELPKNMPTSFGLAEGCVFNSYVLPTSREYNVRS